MHIDASYSMKDDRKQIYTDRFMESYDKYSDDIFRFCMTKTSDRDTSLDLTQETFTKFWSYITKGNEIKNERPLIYRIANNLIVDHYRKKKDILVENLSMAPEYQEHLKDDSQRKLEDNFDAEQALLLLKQLPESTREIVNLRFVHDFSVTEIANVLNKDPKTVSVYLHRGLKKLRKILEQYEK